MLSILSYMRQGEYLLAIIAIFSRCFVVFCCMPIHEAAHAFVAYKLGDDTAKRQGRLTLNPLAHLNPLGTIMIFLFGIGYGQAVPVDERNFKNPKAGMALTALAGPVSNLLLGWISVWLYYILYRFLGTGKCYACGVQYFTYTSARRLKNPCRRFARQGVLQVYAV